jgi:uncharacterized protein YraI
MEHFMSMRRLLAAAVLLGAMALPGLASAQVLAFAVYGTTNMRAGPGTQYPVIARIAGGSAVHVYGCIPERVWCDAQVQGIRGWVASSRLEFAYRGRRVPVVQYYGYFGAPYVYFDFGYWDRHYRDRPWYRDRYRWRDNDRDRDRQRDRPRANDDRPRERAERRGDATICDGANLSCPQGNR